MIDYLHGRNLDTALVRLVNPSHEFGGIYIYIYICDYVCIYV